MQALAAGYTVVAAGLGRPGLCEVEYVSLEVQASWARAAVNQAAGALRMAARRYEAAYWGNALLAGARGRLDHLRPDVVVANDVPALPLALAVAHGAPVVLDAHEYTPLEYADRRLWRWLIGPYMEHITRRYVSRATRMSTVAPALAERYAADGGPPPVVVTNAPPAHDLDPTPVGHPIRMLHMGTADRSRHIEDMIDLVDTLDERFTLDLILMPGSDPRYLRALRKRALRRPLVRFLDTVPMRELVTVANAYDVGLYLLPPVNFNNANALPNKLFEFIQARLAVAIGPSPAMAQVVREWSCGVVASDFSPAALAAVLNPLRADDIAAYKARSHVAAQTLNAEANQTLVRALVEEALAVGAQPRRR